MRLRLVPFGRDNRPVRPWWEWFAPIIIPLMLTMSAITVCLILGWAAVSPVLPRSWRLDWDTAFELDPTIDAECPECHARLALGVPVQTDQGHQFVMTGQSAKCLQCQRHYHRFSLGKVWSSWRN